MIMATAKRPSMKSLSEYPTYFPEIGLRFRELRQSRGLTQVQFAESIGANISTIKNIELYGITPNIFLLRQVRKVYHVSYDWLIDGH